MGCTYCPVGHLLLFKPNEAAFEKEMKGLPSTRSMVAIPPELHCPLCNDVMKDAVFTSKCIRDCIVSMSMCFCEAKNVLADDLLPNTTVRDPINRIMESGNSIIDTVGSDVCVQDMESALHIPVKIPSPIQAVATKEEQKLPSNVEESQSVKKVVDGNNASDTPLQQILPETFGKQNIIKVPDVSEATHDSARVKELVSQSGALPVGEVQQKLVASDARKKRKVYLPPNAPNSYFSEADRRRTGMLPDMNAYVAPSNINSYWQGYYLGPTNMPYQNAMPPQSFWPQNYPIPQRYHAAEHYTSIDVQRPFPSTKGLEVCRTNVKSGKYNSSNANVLTMKSKHKPPQVRKSPSADHHYDENREPERSRKRSLHHDQEQDRDDHHRLVRCTSG